MNILITGGSSGLGAELVKTLASDKENTVFFTYANSKENAQLLERTFDNAHALHLDFADTDSVNQLVQKIKELDFNVLINNAYTSITKAHFNKMGDNVFGDSFMLNVIPTLKITQEAINVFRKKKFGKIINILTSAIEKPPIGWSEYAANKAYLLSMSKSWGIENIKFNITSNCVSPGFMETGFNKDVDERILEDMRQNHPLKKLLTVEETAEAVLYMMKLSQQFNGINLII